MRYPNMQGIYFYADYCTGRIWSLERTGNTWRSSPLLESGINISTFGEDQAGELYLADHVKGDIYLVAGGPPSITRDSVVNAASFEPGVSPGAIATIFGSGLTLLPGVVQAATVPLPRDLSGVSVTFNGIAAPLFAIANLDGQEQINVQVPYEISGPKATVVVSNHGLKSAPVEVDVLPAQPGVFSTDGLHAAALHAADFQLVSPARPAHSNELILLYATALGPVETPPATGELVPNAPLSRTTAQPLVTIGGRPATVLFSGLAPQFAGLYQINIRIPPDVPSGDQDLLITIAGRAAKPVKLAVAPSAPPSGP